MKRFTLLVAMIATAFAVKAQDLIVLRNATEISAKVVAITPESITYKRWSNQDGPTYTISKSEVFYIKYQNGEKDVMSEVAAPARTYSVQPQSRTTAKSNITPIKFSGHLLVGTMFGSVDVPSYHYDEYWDTYLCDGLEKKFTAGPTLDLSVGAKFFEHFYLGFETGFHSMIYEVAEEHKLYGSVPLGVNMKGYFTRGKNVNPYVNLTLGGFVGVGDYLSNQTGFHCQIGVGFEAGRFSLGIGYACLKIEEYDYTQNNGYVKLGVRFGK